LLALNPLFVRWAIEARPYSLATFFAVVSTGALLTAIERGGRRNWFAYGVLSLCMMLFHPLAIFVLVAHVVTVVATNRRSAWFGQAVVLGGVLVLIGPLALVAVGQRAQVSWIPSPRPTTFFTALTDVSGGRIPAIGLVICSLIVLLAAIRATAHSDERFLTTLVLSWALLPSLAMVAVSFLHPIYVDRYALVSVPGVAIVVTMAARHIWNLLLAHSGASGSASTPEASARFAPRTVSTRTASSSPVGVVLVVAFGIAPLWLAHKSWGVVRQPYYIDDYRTASAVFQADLHGDDVTILVVKADAGRGFAFYAWSRRLREELLHPAALSLPTVVHRPSSVPARLTQRGIIWSQDAPSACSGVVGIGWDSTPNLRFDIEGRTCELGNVRHFGLVWVANSEAV
jgi:4-amino-4-deoxy-L-arabinose transferase-like glycosyltransferase